MAAGAHGEGDNNWYIAEIYTVAVQTGKAKSIFKPAHQVANPRWSPDGKAIAFISGLMSDEGTTGGDVFMVPSDGGDPVNLTPEMKASAGRLHWLPSSHQILFEENVDGETGIATVRRFDASDYYGVARGRDDHVLRLVNECVGGSRWENIGGGSQFPPARAGSLGRRTRRWKQITRVNGSRPPMCGEAKSLHWTNEGLNIQGWLIYPHPYDPQRKYPLVVSVHGGPVGMHRPAWPTTFFDFRVLSSEGYFVLLPNPRGSLGAGEGFTRQCEGFRVRRLPRYPGGCGGGL